MSRPEIDTFSIAVCPCGAGDIKKHVTTYGDPWSGADIRISIDCITCRLEWEVHGNQLVFKSSKNEYIEALDRRNKLSCELNKLENLLIDDYFDLFAAKSKKAELSEMIRLGISTFSYSSYVRHRANGRTPAQACDGLKNLPWLMQLAESRSLKNNLENLISMQELCAVDVKKASEKIIYRGIQ